MTGKDMTVSIKVEDLQFSYKNNPVLHGVNFFAEADQCICLLGENGAGKTTLFRCLLGLLGGYSGGIYIDGIDGKNLSIRQLAKKIAYIPQAHEPTFNYTVFETVLMGTSVLMDRFHTPGQRECETVEQMLSLLNISHLAERGYAEISGGERQLTLIARALAQRSRILVMDEPTANLDYGNQFRVMRQVKQLARSGYLVVLSTHNPEHALLYSDKVLVLKDGKAMIYGAPEEVLNPALIHDVYGVSVELQKMSTAQGDVPVFVPCI
ncbi:MAG: ABC transporter ATP-binding protein [Oscillospiraceae bacterium]|nr:ABC transporter ATP-binding protein [Oscillospiraceae bacterium]